MECSGFSLSTFCFSLFLFCTKTNNAFHLCYTYPVIKKHKDSFPKKKERNLLPLVHSFTKVVRFVSTNTFKFYAFVYLASEAVYSILLLLSTCKYVCKYVFRGLMCTYDVSFSLSFCLYLFVSLTVAATKSRLCFLNNESNIIREPNKIELSE